MHSEIHTYTLKKTHMSKSTQHVASYTRTHYTQHSTYSMPVSNVYPRNPIQSHNEFGLITASAHCCANAAKKWEHNCFCLYILVSIYVGVCALRQRCVRTPPSIGHNCKHIVAPVGHYCCYSAYNFTFSLARGSTCVYLLSCESPAASWLY